MRSPARLFHSASHSTLNDALRGLPSVRRYRALRIAAHLLDSGLREARRLDSVEGQPDPATYVPLAAATADAVPKGSRMAVLTTGTARDGARSRPACDSLDIQWQYDVGREIALARDVIGLESDSVRVLEEH